MALKRVNDDDEVILFVVAYYEEFGTVWTAWNGGCFDISEWIEMVFEAMSLFKKYK